MRCMTRCTARTFWLWPTNAAKPMAERQESTAKGSRTSRHRVRSDGWTNGRKSGRTEPINHFLCGDLYTEAGLETAAARSARDPRWGSGKGSSFGTRTHIRSRPAAGQYAYGKDRSALDAVRHVHQLINTGHGEIVDADLSSYCDTLPHSELLKSVARRVVDGAMLHLIKLWLEAPVEETDEGGNQRRSTRNRDEGRGTPQGSPISPLLSNL